MHPASHSNTPPLPASTHLMPTSAALVGGSGKHALCVVPAARQRLVGHSRPGQHPCSALVCVWRCVSAPAVLRSRSKPELFWGRRARGMQPAAGQGLKIYSDAVTRSTGQQANRDRSQQGYYCWPLLLALNKQANSDGGRWGRRSAGPVSAAQAIHLTRRDPLLPLPRARGQGPGQSQRARHMLSY